MADSLSDRIAYQRMCVADLLIRGRTLYNDQGIVFHGSQPHDIMRDNYVRAASQVPQQVYRGGAPDGYGNDDDDDDNDDRRGLPHSNDNPGRSYHEPGYPHRNSGPLRGGGSSGGGSGSGGGGGGDGSGGGNDDDPPWDKGQNPPVPNGPRSEQRGYSMPPLTLTGFNTPGVMAAEENHCSLMHDRLKVIIEQHLSRRLRIPEASAPFAIHHRLGCICCQRTSWPHFC